MANTPVTIRELRTEFTASVKGLVEASKAAAASVKRITGAVSTATSALKTIGRVVTAPIRIAVNALRKLGAAVVRWGKFVVAGLFAVRVAATKFSADFSQAMAEVSTLVDTSAVNMRFLEESVKDLSVQFGSRPLQQAGALYNAISAGVVRAADAVKILEIANKAAIAGVTDVNTSLRGIISVINAYGFRMSEAGRISDIFFGTVKEGVLTFPQLSDNLGKVISIAATAGLSFEEVSAALATMTKSGLGVEESVTSLRAILSSIIAPGKEAEGMFRRIRFILESTGRDANNFANIMQVVAEEFGGNAVALNELFGSVRAFSGGAAIASNGARTFNRILASLKNSAGATEEAFGKMSGEISLAFRQVISLGSVLLAEIGDIFEPATRLVLQKFFDVGKELRAFIKKNADELSQFFKDRASATVLLIDAVVMVIQNIWNNTIKPIFAPGGPFGEALKQVDEFIGIFQAMRAGDKGFAESFITALDFALPGIIEGLKGVFDSVKESIVSIVTFLWKEMVTGYKAFVTTAKVIWQTDVVPALKISIEAALSSAFDTSLNKLKLKIGKLLVETGLQMRRQGIFGFLFGGGGGGGGAGLRAPVPAAATAGAGGSAGASAPQEVKVTLQVEPKEMARALQPELARLRTRGQD